jgi:hypothetical protein
MALGYKVVSSSETDSGKGLFSEVMGIPLLMRGESITNLWPRTLRSWEPTLWNGRTLGELIGLPTVSSAKPMSGLMASGTIFGKMGLPEIWR